MASIKNNSSAKSTKVTTGQEVKEDWSSLSATAISFANVGRMKEVTMKNSEKVNVFEVIGYNSEGIKHVFNVWNNEGNPNGDNMFKFFRLVIHPSNQHVSYLPIIQLYPWPQ
jgi:hypothetical protein